MRDLNFYVSVYDDREELNTILQNSYAHAKNHVNYELIGELIPGGSDFVVIMTFGYRSDSVVLRKLISKKFRYLGLLGSKSKIEKMLTELRNDGFEEKLIQSIHAPVGMQINSQTPEEIAVSIAAEIIKLKNS
jgi:xanthine dehydrogenase accessory factor